MLPGFEIPFGAETKICPRYNVGAMRRLWPAIEDAEKRLRDPATSSAATRDVLLVQVAVIHSALSRNYPDLRVEEVEEALSPGEVTPVFARLMRYSNAAPDAPPPPAEEPLSAGEAAPPAAK